MEFRKKSCIRNTAPFYFLSLLFISSVHGDSKDDSANGKNFVAAKFASNASGKSVAVWQKKEEHSTIKGSIFDGTSWQEPVNLSEEGQNAYRPEVCINDKGQIVAIWQRFDKYNFIIQVSHYCDGAWSTPINLSEPGQNAFNPAICINDDGKAFAVWRRFNGKYFVIQVSTYDGACWSMPTDLSNPFQNADSPEISCDAAGTAATSWKQFDGKNQITQTSYFNGSAWSDTQAPPAEKEEPTYEDSSTYDEDVTITPVNHNCCEIITCTSSIIEARAAYFRPNSKRLRKIYGDAWFDFGIEGSYAFWNYLLAWLDAEYTFAYGNTLGGNEPTDISIFPLSFGLKAAVHYCCLQPYIGLGPKFFFVWVNNDSFILSPKENFSTVGGVVKFGSYYFPCDHIALSFFIDYSFAKKNFHSSDTGGITRTNLDLSNLLIGGSFGASF